MLGIVVGKSCLGELVDIWHGRGLYDEVRQLVALVAFRVNHVSRGVDKRLYFACTPVEAPIMRVIARIAIALTCSNASDVLDGRISARYVDQWLCALNPSGNVIVHSANGVFSGPRARGVGVVEMSATYDDFQEHICAPPVGIVPNHHSLCYAVSSLLVLLSIGAVEEQLRLAPRSDLVDILLIYCSHYRYDCFSADELRELNVSLIRLPQFRAFKLDSPDDARDFILALLAALRICAPALAAMFTVETIPRLKFHHEEIIEESSEAETVEMPVEEDGVIRLGVGKMPRSIPRRTFYYESGCGDVVTFENVIGGIVRDGRQFLVLFHDLRQKDAPSKMKLECSIVVGGHRYSIHGVIMYDSLYSSGHYVSLVVCRTSMFFYDPQYIDTFEDLRQYRPRAFVYVRVN